MSAGADATNMMIDCPLCQRAFTSDQIERHASKCTGETFPTRPSPNNRAAAGTKQSTLSSFFRGRDGGSANTGSARSRAGKQPASLSSGPSNSVGSSHLARAASTGTPWGRKVRGDITLKDVFGTPETPAPFSLTGGRAVAAAGGEDADDALLDAALSAFEQGLPALVSSSAASTPRQPNHQHSFSTPLYQSREGSSTRGVWSGTAGASGAQELSSPDAVMMKLQQPPTSVPDGKRRAGAESNANANAPKSSSDEVEGLVDDADLPQFDHYSGKEWIYPSNYPERSYQRSITSKCLFRNTLVALPTGLGKTFIAAVVMYNYYRWFPSGMVIFMAPTKPLVTQQIRACFDIMGFDRNDICDLTGSIQPAKRIPLYRTKRVVFASPQVIQNDLENGHCPVERIVCVVIDEAHRAVGDHAYVAVVNHVHKSHRHFRLVALSATPGDSSNKVQQLIKNLYINNIELRSEASLDVQEYCHKKKVVVEVIQLGPILGKIKAQFLNDVLQPILTRLLRKGATYTKDADKCSKFQLMQQRKSWLAKAHANQTSRDQRNGIEADFALATSLYHGYEALLTHGLNVCMNHLTDDKVSESGSAQVSSRLRRDKKVSKLYSDIRAIMSKPAPESESRDSSGAASLGAGAGAGAGSATAPMFTVCAHPKLDKLRVVVQKHLATAKGSTRVMIFTQYRDSIDDILSVLAECPSIKAQRFVGQATTSKTKTGAKKKGMKQKEQIDVIERFKSGEFNTLVATSIGEEGLDIGDVDLIVCFDQHGSSTRLVQRMGRTGRKRDGKVVMLMTEGREEAQYRKAVSTKATVFKAVIERGNAFAMYLNSPRMLPKGHNPVIKKQMVTTGKFSPPNATRGGSRVKHKAGSPYLTPAQTRTYEAEYAIHDGDGDSRDGGSDQDGPPSNSVAGLRLDRFIAYQSLPDAVLRATHSRRCHTMMNVLDLIDGYGIMSQNTYQTSVEDKLNHDLGALQRREPSPERRQKRRTKKHAASSKTDGSKQADKQADKQQRRKKPTSALFDADLFKPTPNSDIGSSESSDDDLPDWRMIPTGTRRENSTLPATQRRPRAIVEPGHQDRASLHSPPALPALVASRSHLADEDFSPSPDTVEDDFAVASDSINEFDDHPFPEPTNEHSSEEEVYGEHGTTVLEPAACPLLAVSSKLFGNPTNSYFHGTTGGDSGNIAVPTSFRWFRRTSSSILPPPPSDISLVVTSLLTSRAQVPKGNGSIASELETTRMQQNHVNTGPPKKITEPSNFVDTRDVAAQQFGEKPDDDESTKHSQHHSAVEVSAGAGGMGGTVPASTVSAVPEPAGNEPFVNAEGYHKPGFHHHESYPRPAAAVAALAVKVQSNDSKLTEVVHTVQNQLVCAALLNSNVEDGGDGDGDGDVDSNCNDAIADDRDDGDVTANDAVANINEAVPSNAEQTDINGRKNDDSEEDDEDMINNAMANMELPSQMVIGGLLDSESDSNASVGRDSLRDSDDDDDNAEIVPKVSGILGALLSNDDDDDDDDDEHHIPSGGPMSPGGILAASQQLSNLSHAPSSLQRSLSSSSASGSLDYEVSQIVDERDGEVLVKWKGYPSTKNTWEPTESMEQAPAVLRDFRQRTTLDPGARSLATDASNRITIAVEETDEEEDSGSDSDAHEEDEEEDSPVIATKGRRRRTPTVLLSQSESQEVQPGEDRKRLVGKRPQTIPESDEDDEKERRQSVAINKIKQLGSSSENSGSTPSPNPAGRRLLKRKKKLTKPSSPGGQATERKRAATNMRSNQRKQPRPSRKQVAKFFDSAAAADGDDGDDDDGGVAGEHGESDYCDGSQDSFINDSDPYTPSETDSSSQSHRKQQKASQISPDIGAIYLKSLLSPVDAGGGATGKHSFGPRGQYGGAENKLVYGAVTPSPSPQSREVVGFNYDNPMSPRQVGKPHQTSSKRSIR